MASQALTATKFYLPILSIFNCVVGKTTFVFTTTNSSLNILTFLCLLYNSYFLRNCSAKQQLNLQQWQKF